tara:strand:- start:161 stop:310 length:150 start_codon:yes stop_codon:yes gene_type:complete
MRKRGAVIAMQIDKRFHKASLIGIKIKIKKEKQKGKAEWQCRMPAHDTD